MCEPRRPTDHATHQPLAGGRNQARTTRASGNGKTGGFVLGGDGVGLKLGRLMKDLYGPAMGVLEGLKQQLDPNNIMNPGKMGFKGA